MSFELDNNIATLGFDDGKANVVNHNFLDQINAGLDRAEEEKVGAVILRGRAGMFSAGFDLGEFKKGPEVGQAMVTRGFELLIRLYSFPLPVVACCTGHGIAMGAFMLMASDTRIGVSGDFKLSLPETAISMDLPQVLMALADSRIAKRHLTRVAIQSEVYNPQQAVEAGFLDEVVAAEELDSRTTAAAEKLAQLPQKYYASNKLAARSGALAAMREGLAQMTQQGQ